MTGLTTENIRSLDYSSLNAEPYRITNTMLRSMLANLANNATIRTIVSGISLQSLNNQ